MDIVTLAPGEEIILVSFGDRYSGKRAFVIRGISKGIGIGVPGRSKRSGITMRFGKEKLFAGSARGSVIGSVISVGYAKDIVSPESVPLYEIS